MKKGFVCLLILSLLLTLCACGGNSAPRLELNETLVGLIGEDNAALQEVYSGRCYAQTTLKGPLRVTYFDPYISIVLEEPKEGEPIWAEGEKSGFYAENPFVDGLKIQAIEFCENFDPMKPVIESQDSLRQLFQCDEEITYDFLCRALGQTPTLKFTDNAYYDSVLVDGAPEMRYDETSGLSDLGERISGGAYRASFRSGEVRMTIYFLGSEEEGYTAFNARIKKGRG